ncbi:hypothetical protein Tdes44962_MAKER03030 [Teratosphaeria destructans]|uniref:Uncharacterized protein n=1 Tax=Teratosphaeria destructans TaxID=418781 RepID=A0A9W7SRJ4_9PEZI|nr:hypothetical protein Tdes44962_MAKER03030 [Teratosphaeria destructans]
MCGPYPSDRGRFLSSFGAKRDIFAAFFGSDSLDLNAGIASGRSSVDPDDEVHHDTIGEPSSQAANSQIVALEGQVSSSTSSSYSSTYSPARGYRLDDSPLEPPETASRGAMHYFTLLETFRGDSALYGLPTDLGTIRELTSNLELLVPTPQSSQHLMPWVVVEPQSGRIYVGRDVVQVPNTMAVLSVEEEQPYHWHTEPARALSRSMLHYSIRKGPQHLTDEEVACIQQFYRAYHPQATEEDIFEVTQACPYVSGQESL